jgi:transcriptional regulator with XRE-family HTH domain
MDQVAHWTQNSIAHFVYEISSTFVAQLETKMEQESISRSKLAMLLNKSTGRVSQVFNDPGNLSLRVIVEYARRLGMKVSIVAYDDKDPNNENGPVNPEVFVKCWEKQSRPNNLFELDRIEKTSITTKAITTTLPVAGPAYVYGPVLNAGQTLWANPVTELHPSEGLSSLGSPHLSYVQANWGTALTHPAPRNRKEKAA